MRIFNDLLMSFFGFKDFKKAFETPFYIENPNNTSIQIGFTYLNSSTLRPVVEFSYDKVTWDTPEVEGMLIIVPANGKVYLRSNTPTWYIDNTNSAQLYTRDTVDVGGNVMSLIYGSNFTGDEETFPSNTGHNLSHIFSETNVRNANKLILPATTLTESVYHGMFQDCTDLVTAPVLFGMELSNSCYEHMFDGCTSLITAPTLKADEVPYRAYFAMFRNCISLTTPPALPATTLGETCYCQMFEGSGITTAPVLPAETLELGCYWYMFRNCTSLSTSPDLNAEIPVQAAYAYMFSGCSSLSRIKCMLKTNPNNIACTEGWVSGVSATGTFICDENNSDWTEHPDWYPANSLIPSGWTVQYA